MYKVYTVDRTDKVGWDEYAQCVVVARDEEEAYKVEIKEVELNESKAVMGDFNAG